MEKFPNHSETPKENKIDKAGLQGKLKEKLLNSIDSFLRNFLDDSSSLHSLIQGAIKDFEKLHEAKEMNEQLSNEVGDFFRDLIPNGLRKPEEEGIPNIGSYNLVVNFRKK